MAAQLIICPITLDPLVDLVTTPCGHSVCRAPIPNAHLPYFGLGVNIVLCESLQEQERMRAQLASLKRASRPPLSVSDIVIAPGWPLGRGAFGLVSEATVHVTVKQTPADDEYAARAMKRELEALTRLSHPHIVQLLGLAEHAGRNEVWLVLELAEHGSLHALLQPGRHAELSAAFGDGHALPGATRTFYRLAFELSCALAFLHRSKVVHGDVKTANVLICGGGKAKLADFGLATIAHMLGSQGLSSVTHSQLRGTVQYMAPEVARADACTAASDVFSAAVLLAQLLSGERPLAGLPSFNEVVLVGLIARGERPGLQLPEGTPAELQRLLERCSAGDPADRPDAAALQLEQRAIGSELVPYAGNVDAAGAAEPGNGGVAAIEAAQAAARAEVAQVDEAELRRMPWPQLGACLRERTARAGAAHAVLALRVVAERASGRETAGVLSVLPALVAAMRAHAANADVQEQACRALHNITAGDNARAQAAADAGALPQIVAAMRAHAATQPCMSRRAGRWATSHWAYMRRAMRASRRYWTRARCPSSSRRCARTRPTQPYRSRHAGRWSTSHAAAMRASRRQ